jgi:hypothetical protein
MPKGDHGFALILLASSSEATHFTKRNMSASVGLAIQCPITTLDLAASM